MQVFMKMDFEEFIQLNEYPRDIGLFAQFFKYSANEMTGLYMRQPWLPTDKFNFEMYSEIVKECKNL